MMKKKVILTWVVLCILTLIIILLKFQLIKSTKLNEIKNQQIQKLNFIGNGFDQYFVHLKEDMNLLISAPALDHFIRKKYLESEKKLRLLLKRFIHAKHLIGIGVIHKDKNLMLNVGGRIDQKIIEKVVDQQQENKKFNSINYVILPDEEEVLLVTSIESAQNNASIIYMRISLHHVFYELMGEHDIGENFILLYYDGENYINSTISNYKLNNVDQININHRRAREINIKSGTLLLNYYPLNASAPSNAKSWIIGIHLSNAKLREILSASSLASIPFAVVLILCVVLIAHYINKRNVIHDRTANIVQKIATGITELGTSFFSSLAYNLGTMLQTDYVIIGQLSGKNTVQTLAIYDHGEVAENMEYELRNTPCEDIVHSKVDQCMYWGNVVNIYPKDKLLKQMDVDTYIGIKLTDSNGNAIGLISMLHNNKRKALRLKEVAESILKIVAARVSAELERKLMEDSLIESQRQAQEANQAKNKFIAKMNHEFRTPLNGVIGMIDLLYSTEINDEQEEYLSILKSSTKMLLSIISNTLDFIKIESGSYSKKVTAVDLGSFIEKLVVPLKLQAKLKQLKLSFDIDKNIAQYIEMDEVAMWQVLNNLISNAIKFTEQGSVQLRIFLEEPEKIVFEVLDTGCGIKQEDLAIIFDDFLQLRGNTQGNSGSGLGLSITKKLISQIGGEVSVQSILDKGSQFTVKLDYKVAQKIELVRENNITASHGNVLVVEDNRTNQLLLCKMLEKAGYDTEVADDGERAIELYKQNKYDIVLMDVQLPTLDGITASKIIRSYEKENSENVIPIIAITALATEEDRVQCLNSGMNDYISKPIQRIELLKCMQKWTTT